MSSRSSFSAAVTSTSVTASHCSMIHRGSPCSTRPANLLAEHAGVREEQRRLPPEDDDAGQPLPHPGSRPVLCQPSAAGTSRPRTSPWGHQLRRKNSKIERATAITIPCNTPSRTTPRSRRPTARTPTAAPSPNTCAGSSGRCRRAPRRSRRPPARSAGGPQQRRQEQQQDRHDCRPDEPGHLRLGPACSATAVRDPLAEIANPWNRPARRWPRPSRSSPDPDRPRPATRGEARRGRDRVGEGHQAMPSAAMNRGPRSLGHAREALARATPAAAPPRSSLPWRPGRRPPVTTVAPTTATSTAGTFFDKRGRISRTASVARPTSRAVVFVSLEPETNALSHRRTRRRPSRSRTASAAARR